MANKNTPASGSRDPGSGRNAGGLSKAQQRAQRAQQQQAELAARKRQETVRRVVLTTVAAVALVALIVVLVFVGKNHNNDSAKAPSGTSIPKIGTTKYGLTVGDPKAPHQVIIYEDFLCPYCGHLELESEAKLQAEAKAGKVYIEYRPFNLLSQDGPYSAEALNAFIAVKELAGDGAALQFHNLLYHNQPTEPGPQGDDSKALIALADKVVPQADQSKVDDAITNDTYKSAVQQVTSDVEQGAGIQGTPTVYFDGKSYTDTSGTHTDAYAAYENMADNLIKAVQ